MDRRRRLLRFRAASAGLGCILLTVALPRSAMISGTNPMDVEKLARHLFQVDTQVSRDRIQYGCFEAMPSNLQDWWRDRAARRIAEQMTGGGDGS
jgi:hypothetical protein